ncbi:MAG: trehalose-phosphatase [Dehalococcoidia bacterium]
MPQLLNVWPSVSKQIRRASRILLLFDYDGTLTPIVARPELARLAEETRDKLIKLHRQEKFLLGVISGRSLEDVAQRVGVAGLVYAGNHGLEIRGPGIDFRHPQAEGFQASLDRLDLKLREVLAGCSGVIMEHKGLSLTVHYRLTPEDQVPEVEGRFFAAVSLYEESGQVRITRGKMVWEIRPNVAWDKGKTILELRRLYPEHSLVFYFGDDLTDEDGFAVVQESGGVAVFVGEARQPTRALYRLDSPKEVGKVLDLIAQLNPAE